MAAKIPELGQPESAYLRTTRACLVGYKRQEPGLHSNEAILVRLVQQVSVPRIGIKRLVKRKRFWNFRDLAMQHVAWVSGALNVYESSSPIGASGVRNVPKPAALADNTDGVKVEAAMKHLWGPTIELSGAAAPMGCSRCTHTASA